MLNRSVLSQLERSIAECTGKSTSITHAQAVAGGDINACYLLTCDDSNYFVKTNTANHALDMFDKEHQSLFALSGLQTIKVPQPIVTTEIESSAYLVMEALELSREQNWEGLGLGLAELHTRTDKVFGWQTHTYIGKTIQQNTPSADWASFWWETRFQPQLHLAYSNGYSSDLERYEAGLKLATERLLDHKPSPSLVHGDLWSGNVGGCRGGVPTVFDPAIYYGDREVDIAMTKLFGGFSPAFYLAYENAWPLPAGHVDRAELYNLYHLLNHLNLFGDSYLRSCSSCIARLVSR